MKYLPIKLIPVHTLKNFEKKFLVDLFLTETTYPVRSQTWNPEDVEFFYEKKEVKAILKFDGNQFIGYVYIDDKENCIEIFIHNQFLNKGFGLYAILLSIKEYFDLHPKCSSIVTRIHHLNLNSLNQALRFGWEIHGYNNEWLCLSLSKEFFLKKYIYYLSS